MCGIAAILKARKSETLSLIRSMTDIVRHRGPDGEGFAVIGRQVRLCGGPDTPPNVYGAGLPYSPNREFHVESDAHSALGHRRLSIVDLSPTGHQPMCDSNKRYWITYNGEIYNYIELRKELESLGHRFMSQTDTEVILAAYDQWGEACLNRFNGMWAFVLIDVQKQVAFVARDRFGVKPLYYWPIPDGGLAIASEIKQFTVLPGWKALANLPRCYDFLVRMLFDHTDETFFRNVFQLPGGACMTVSLQGDMPPNVRRWYTLPHDSAPMDLSEAAEKFLDLLSDSVRLRLRADVKVGSCLSGGLDSSSIVCLVNQQLRAVGRQDLQETVSSCFDIARFDERTHIEAVARHTRIKTHYVFPQLRDLFGLVAKILWHQDEPFGSTSIYAQWHVFQEARRQGLTVMLDGQGADEELAGYHGYFAPWFTQLFRSFRWFTLGREIKAWHRRHGYPYKMAIKLLSEQMLPVSLRKIGLGLVGRSPNPRWLQPEFLGQVRAQHSDPERTNPEYRGTLRKFSRGKLLLTSLPMLLHYEDRNSMAHSVEARVPFLDYRLAEFIVRLPDEHKIYDGETKVVLRHAMKDVIPDEVRRRQDKLGFVTPEEVWIREEATEQFRKALLYAAERAPQLFRREGLVERFESYLKRPGLWDYTLWRIICFALWMDAYKVEF